MSLSEYELLQRLRIKKTWNKSKLQKKERLLQNIIRFYTFEDSGAQSRPLPLTVATSVTVQLCGRDSEAWASPDSDGRWCPIRFSSSEFTASAALCVNNWGGQNRGTLQFYTYPPPL